MYAAIITEKIGSLIDGLVKAHPQLFLQMEFLIPYPNLDTG